MYFTRSQGLTPLIIAVLLAVASPTVAFQSVAPKFVPKCASFQQSFSTRSSCRNQSGVSVRAKSSKLHLHLFPKGSRFKSSREKFANLTDNFVPDIPVQDDPRIVNNHPGLLTRLAAQLDPRFVAKEFLFGVRYMCQLLPLLAAGSIFGHMLLCLISLMTTSSGTIGGAALQQTRGVACLVSPYHMLEVEIKVVLAKVVLALRGITFTEENANCFLHPRAIIELMIITPIAEELSYRGVAQYIGKQYIRLQNLVRAYMLRGLGMNLTVAIEVLIVWSVVVGSIASFVGRKPALGGESLFHLSPIIQSVIALVPFLVMRRYVSLDSRSIAAVSGDKKADHINESAVWRRTSKALRTTRRGLGKQPGNSTSYSEVQESIERTASRYGRWYGAFMFGAAHGNGGPLSLQKIFGTITSSLMVESRLVENRRTLWGAFGAHMMYNVSCSSLLRTLFSLKGSAMRYEPKFWVLVIALFPLHVTLIQYVTRSLMLLERKFSDSTH